VSHCSDWLISGLAGAGCAEAAAREGEAEADVAGGAFGEGCGENSRVQVVVVVNLGGCLARMGAQDATRVLDETALECDRRGEEQGVQGWASKVSGVVVFRTKGPDVVISAGAPNPDAHDRL